MHQHTFEIQYTTEPPPEKTGVDDEDELQAHRKLEEKNFHEILADMRASLEEPRTIDLGEVRFAEYHGRLAVVSPPLPNCEGRDAWLLLLPSLNEDFDLAWHDMVSPAVEELMMAWHILKTAGRATIRTHLKMILLPFSGADNESNELPFRLEVVSDLSIVIPSIFESPPKKRTVEFQDAQRRIFDELYPSSLKAPESYEGITNIPYFYSILCPAPLMQPSLQATMQPEELNPTLLPFQRRSVAWLLDREGKSVSPDGTIVPKAESSDFTFWERIEEGKYIWYLNRLSGTLSSTLPAERPVFGGILAEEPGLGKTLEIITLILMNPAPARNPSILQWDPEAKLEIKAIKSTLIVTPPSLASQWADELAVHAPSLKVLMYDGWTKVPVPISRTQVEAERQKLKKARAKALEKTVKTKSTVKSKKAFKGKKYNEDDNMDVDETDDDGDNGIEIVDWCQYVNTFDVVITTYSVLKTDFNVARAAPERPRREDVVYSNVERPRSPLIMVEWNRVVMDEVQMVGGGKAEDMVSLIPRVSSFAVSGTPARAQVSDLMHILKFLRVDAIVDSPRLWKRMISSGCGARHFASLFRTYAIRTLKSNVKDELTIPQQTRFLVNISMGPVEKHVYDQALEAVLLDLGLDARGVSASGGWEVDGALLRSSIRRLRGICTHPQVGQLQRAGDKFYKPGSVKTIEDVLQNMRDQNWRDMMDDYKAKVNAIITAAQLQQRDERDINRYKNALATLIQAEKEATALTEDVKNALAEHSVKGALLKKEASTAIPEDERLPGKGKERQRDVSEVTQDSSDNDLPHSPAGDEHGKKRGALQNRLRECRLILHRVKFLQGDLHHILGASHSVAEDAAYAAAEEIRRSLLKGTEEDAQRAMAQLTQDATKKNITKDALMLITPFIDGAGFMSLIEKYESTDTELEPTDAELKKKLVPSKVALYKRATASQELVEEVNEIIDDVLNEQSSLLWGWRNTIISLLTQKLSPGEDEADGEEYQRTLDNQGEAETYLQSYSALLADRRQALINERTLLAAHDVREKKLRHTKAAIKATAAAHARLEISADVELQPEHEILHIQLSAKRKDLLERLNGRAIKSILIDLNTAAARINKDGDPERALLKDAVAALRQLIIDQGTLLDKLDADLALIRKAFNQRILYFRQLQEISDSVTEITWESALEVALTESLAERKELEAKINTTRARQRYLEHLAKTKDDGVTDEDENCILCRCDFTRGFITQCGHVFCEGCMKAWLLRKEGRTCPVCRVPINPDTIQRFTVNQPDEEPAPKTMPNKEPAPKSRRQIAYSMIDPKLLSEIQSTGSFGDFGTKIQTLVRHVLYLQMADPGGKSIIFSAWADSLHIMERALRDNGIPCLRIDQKSKGESAAKRFKNDPDIPVLLLHGERENAGLNVTCASRVFLLESVVHHGFEIQAIARIDRMGQTRPTEVYCYYAEDTVERNILDLAARQGLSLYTKENSAGTLNVSSLGMNVETKTVDSPVKRVQKGDFIFKIDDMLAILFPHMYEDVEYLLPSEDVEMVNGEIENSIRSSSRNVEGNAIPGPSRLP
ncbi:SNF2 family N-terminal domain-containing protein [Collybia nuda]|uniref:SNF2 family N-terminal domain-containing protein n=1 Tax=Collybia nuda TaxID=64659 RepID=A0A9P5Y198_9AGAR|nr:SNF2 family N-terminal domain-containing protein [Collybia nuda]